MLKKTIKSILLLAGISMTMMVSANDTCIYVDDFDYMCYTLTQVNSNNTAELIYAMVYDTIEIPHQIKGKIESMSDSVWFEVTSIDEEAYEISYYLKSIDIPNTVTHIGARAFSSLTDLHTVHLADTCVRLTIDNNAFFGCINLRSVTLPVGTDTLRDYAFRQCHGMKTLVIPNTVKYIGEEVWMYCDGLKDIYVEWDAEQLHNYHFGSRIVDGVPTTCNLHVPAVYVPLYKNTAPWSKFNIVADSSYVILYELNGGALAPGKTNPERYRKSSRTFTLNNPTRAGYNFAGWTGTGVATAQKTITIEHGSTGNRTYTAQWTPIEYAITFDLDGGAFEEGKVNDTTYAEGSNFALYNPVKAGYVFRGWNTKGNLFAALRPDSTGARSYKALWEKLPEAPQANTFALSGIPVGWTVKIGEDTVPVTNGVTADIVPNTPVRLCPPQGVRIKDVTLNPLIDLSLLSGQDTILCVEGDTITGTANGDILIFIPDNVHVFLKNIDFTNTAEHPAVFCQGNATISCVGTNSIRSATPHTPGLQAFGAGKVITFTGGGQVIFGAEGQANNIDLNGATMSIQSGTTVLGNTPIVYAPLPKTLTYNGANQELVYAGLTNAGTFQYSLDSLTWSTAIPMASKADTTYTIYYKVEADSFYYGAETGKVEIVISPSTILPHSAFTESYVSTIGGCTFTNPVVTTSTGKISYASADTRIATVDSLGKVTLLRADTSTTITATIEATEIYPEVTLSYKVSAPAPLNTIWTFAYTGAQQRIVIPSTGVYQLEVWGAQGGTTIAGGKGGKGGYAIANSTREYNDTLYLYVGGAGANASNSNGGAGGWNGGGAGANGYSENFYGGGGGGGATHISFASGDAINATNHTQINTTNYLIIAGGGGGEAGHPSATAGAGGGNAGGSGKTTANVTYGNWYHNAAYSYGKSAGKAANYSWGCEGSGGGGAGYQGGNAQGDHGGNHSDAGGCGGSSKGNTSKVSGFDTTEGIREGNGYIKITYLNNGL